MRYALLVAIFSSALSVFAGEASKVVGGSKQERVCDQLLAARLPYQLFGSLGSNSDQSPVDTAHTMY